MEEGASEPRFPKHSDGKRSIIQMLPRRAGFLLPSDGG